MEPLSVIGLVGDIVGLIDSSLRSVDVAKNIYKSATGSTAENDHLAFVASEVRKRAVTLEAKKSEVLMNDDEKSLDVIAKKCRHIADNLLTLLGTLQAAKTKSVSHSVRATLRNIRKKDDKNDLFEQLEKLGAQLHQQLTCINQTDMIERLEKLILAADGNQTMLDDLQTHIKGLKSGVEVTFLSPDAINQLRGVVNHADRVLLVHRQNAVKAAMQVPDLDSRFLEVSGTHEDTFRWVLQGPEDEPANEAEYFKKGHGDEDGDRRYRGYLSERVRRAEASTLFVNWLKHGNGIFHISGKPGAGKSTLMKFLCRSPLTHEHLTTWTGEGQALVLSRFFFWKEGSKQQKSLSGLLRGLLFHLLDNSPDLIPTAFPGQWDATESFQNGVAPIPDADIETAFSRLMSDKETYRSHKFVFFIDGLDEFDGDYHQQTKMIQRFFEWTTHGNQAVKLCVSSREWNIFLDAFAACPKLKLQELTLRDMQRLITGRLAANMHYEARSRSEDFSFLEKEILKKAEGVFLWVYLALNAVEEGLGNGDDTDTLRATLENFPSELGQLFEKLFDSIRPVSIGGAIRTFSVVLQLNETALDLLLYRYSFLDRYHKDSDFALRMSPEPLTSEQVDASLSLMRRRVSGHCRGFLEIRKLEDPDYSLPFREYVTLTHRSVAEFLRQKCAPLLSQHGLATFNPTDALLQCFLAQIKTMDAHSPYFTSPRRRKHFINDFAWVLTFSLECKAINARRLSRVVDELQNCLGESYWSSGIVPVDNRAPSSTSHSSTPRLWWILLATYRGIAATPRDSLGSTTISYAARAGNHEFLRVRLDQRDAWALSHLSGGRVFIDILKCMSMNGKDSLPLSRFVRTLDLCFNNGASVEFELGIEWKLWSSWPKLLWYLIIHTSHMLSLEEARMHLVVLEAFLHFGGKADMRLKVTPSNSGSVEVSPDIAGVRSVYCQDTLPIAHLAEASDGIVVLRDLMEIWFPSRAKRLQVMIDGNNMGIRDSSGYWEAMVKMDDVELAEELGTIVTLFPRPGVTPLELLALDGFNDMKRTWRAPI